MCLAVPALITEITDQQALCQVGEATIRARLDLVEEAAVGDYVLVHAGYAINRLEETDALEILSLLEEAAGLDRG